MFMLEKINMKYSLVLLIIIANNITISKQQTSNMSVIQNNNGI